MNKYALHIKEVESCTLIREYYIVPDKDRHQDAVKSLDNVVEGYSKEEADELKSIWDNIKDDNVYIITEIVELL